MRTTASYRKFYKEVPKIVGQRRWTVPAPQSVKLVNTTICKIVEEIWLVVSPRSYAVRYLPRVCQQFIVKSPLLVSALVLISLYNVNVQSHPNTMCGLRRLSLAALTCGLAGHQTAAASKHSVLFHFIFRADGHAHRRTFAKLKH